MILLFHRAYSLIILYAIGLHFLWAGSLIIEPAAIEATALRPFVALLGIPVWVIPAIFCFVACLATTAMLAPEVTVHSIALMLPQQFTLMISAYGALHAVLVGHFGDGVIRPPIFILADQAPALIAAVCHTLAILGMGQKWKQ